MNKKKLIIPALSLSAIIVATKLTGDFNSINIYSTDLSKENVSFYTDETIPKRIEANLRYTFNHTNMVPQGLTISDDYFFISMYDYYHLSNSMINVYDKDGNFVNSCELDNKAHVGGISYDNTNELIWVSSTYGNVDVYRSIDIVNRESAKPTYRDLYLGSNLRSYNKLFKTAISYLTFYNNTLFVGNFTLSEKGIVKQFDISFDKNRTVHLTEINRFKVPSLVQGISFYEKDDKTYMILSRSCGPKIPSALQIYKYNEEINDYTSPVINTKAFRFPPMIEQITSTGDSLYSLYESQAKPYSNKVDSNEKSIKKSNLPKILIYMK